jgi:hypothetical protein
MRLVKYFSFTLPIVLQEDINNFVKEKNALIIDLKIDFTLKYAVLIYEEKG